MPNKAINGPQGNHTSIDKNEEFVPVFTDFPLADIHENKKGELKSAPKNAKIMRDYDIENKK